MDEFGLLTRDLGIRQPGKSAPMSASKPSSASYVGSRSADTNAFGDIFSGYKGPNPNLDPQLNSMPVYDDDAVFASTSNGGHVVVDDILGSLGSDSKRSDDLGGFDELMPGFRGSSPPNKREPEINQQSSVVSSDESPADVSEDPFAVFESTSSSAYPLHTDPLENLGRSMDPGSSNVNASSTNGGTFDDNDAFDGFAKSVPLFTSGKNESRKVKSALESGPSRSVERYSRESFDNAIPRARPTQSFDSSSSIQSPKSNDSSYERNDTENQFPRYSEHLERADNAWLTISEIPLFTEPTRGPPPSRPPPPLVMKLKPYGRADLRRKGKENESYSPSTSSNLHPEVSEFAELERDEGIAPCAQDLGDREQWEREERERVQKILAKERELEREKARQERAEREAHERAVAEARAKAERAAFEKANNEARQRAERATAEARERALAEAREKAVRERINAEARERAAAEAHLRAERERVAAAATRERRYRTENDIESFFGMGARPNSVPKHRATTSETFLTLRIKAEAVQMGHGRHFPLHLLLERHLLRQILWMT